MARARRKRYVGLLAQYLRSDHSPRLEMAVVLGLTALSGFLASVAMLKLGVDAMGLRYPLATLAGYAVFLSLVWCLVLVYRKGADRVLAREEEGFADRDLGELGLPDGPDPSGCLDLPGDEGCAVIAVIGLFFGLLLVSAYFVVAAPLLFAELVLDSLLVGGLYRKLRQEHEGEWFVSALRRTIWPALIVLVLLTLAGLAFSTYAPDARSIGAVVAKWQEGD